MNPIVINGTVLCDNITGIPRYVYETVVRLDKPEPLLGKEELHGTLCHIWSFLCSLGRRDTKPIGNVERTAYCPP